MLVDRSRGNGAREERLVGNAGGQRFTRQLAYRRAVVAAEGVRLRRPVEVTERRREPIEMVLGRIVVADGDHADSSLILLSISASACVICCLRAGCVVCSSWRSSSVRASFSDSTWRTRSGSAPLPPCRALRFSSSRSSIRSARRDSASTSPSPASPMCSPGPYFCSEKSAKHYTWLDREVARGDVLELFHPAVRRWFAGAFEAPTRPQQLGWPAIARGDSTLILAPTGSGKTLAAFLWCLNRLLFEPAPPPKARCRVLYVSPLKALAVDVERNLRAPLAGIANLARES